MEEHITKEHRRLEEFREYPGEYDDTMKEDITKRIDALDDQTGVHRSSKGKTKESDYEL